eukprot:75923-Hanusia_phi.AAC.2
MSSPPRLLLPFLPLLLSHLRAPTPAGLIAAAAALAPAGWRRSSRPDTRSSRPPPAGCSPAPAPQP